MILKSENSFKEQLSQILLSQHDADVLEVEEDFKQKIRKTTKNLFNTIQSNQFI